MKIAQKWTTELDGTIVSEDATIQVQLLGENWIMSDLIDGDIETHPTKKQALDAGARRMLFSKMGNFGVFVGGVAKRGELVFEHQII